MNLVRLVVAVIKVVIKIRIIHYRAVKLKLTLIFSIPLSSEINIS
jgi:hypothetical protein